MENKHNTNLSDMERKLKEIIDEKDRVIEIMKKEMDALKERKILLSQLEPSDSEEYKFVQENLNLVQEIETGIIRSAVKKNLKNGVRYSDTVGEKNPHLAQKARQIEQSEIERMTASGEAYDMVIKGGSSTVITESLDGKSLRGYEELMRALEEEERNLLSTREKNVEGK